ncbi:MAG: LysR family transcriptional regulator [Acidobacteria bacterium]|nr:MAG: LysR family transcriptional regulator [Acidobacteriota bacterium]
MDIELADLQALLVLAETLHFGRAADRLHVSQPALSKRIRRMESRIGGALLVRGYRDVRLTEAGRLLANRSRHLIAEAAATLALTERAARGEAGLLRIGFGIASIFGLLPEVVQRFRRAHPEVQLHLRDMSTPDQIDALVSGEIDVGFIRHRATDDRLQLRYVLDERLVAALGPHSRWDTRAGLRSVASEPFIIIARSRSASFYDHVLSVSAAAGFAPRIVQEADELFTIVSLVRSGLGVSLVPRSAALMRLPGVRFYELGMPEAAWNIALAWHRDSDRVPLVRRFVEAVPPAPVRLDRGVSRRPARSKPRGADGDTSGAKNAR